MAKRRSIAQPSAAFQETTYRLGRHNAVARVQFAGDDVVVAGCAHRGVGFVLRDGSVLRAHTVVNPDRLPEATAGGILALPQSLALRAGLFVYADGVICLNDKADATPLCCITIPGGWRPVGGSCAVDGTDVYFVSERESDVRAPQSAPPQRSSVHALTPCLSPSSVNSAVWWWVLRTMRSQTQRRALTLGLAPPVRPSTSSSTLCTPSNLWSTTWTEMIDVPPHFLEAESSRLCTQEVAVALRAFSCVSDVGDADLASGDALPGLPLANVACPMRSRLTSHHG